MSDNKQQASNSSTNDNDQGSTSRQTPVSKSAPDYPPPTPSEKRTDSVNHGANPDGEGIVKF